MTKPYSVAISEEKLTQLKDKLQLIKLPNELDGAEWEMGTPLSEVHRLVIYWREKFDWRKAESRINQMPQFMTSIEVDGFDMLNIHFVHQRSEASAAIPLLFCHGWPGSFFEVEKLLPLLTASDKKNAIAFHVVAPSLPNFGFSDGVKKRGFGLKQYAEACHKLMQKLGYTEYVTQGGDCGFHITRTMGLLYPDHCKVSHLNVNEGGPPKFWREPILWLQHLLSRYSSHERAGLERTAYHRKHDQAYDLLQQTKPQTLAYALTDSPVGLLAWIYEKMHGWVDDYPWSNDEILIWVSIYWHSTPGVAANLRIYYEALHSAADRMHYDRILQYIPHVKYAVSHFPKDITVFPNSWAAKLGNVVLQNRNPHGGHFAAVEHPEIIAQDLQKLFTKGGPAYGCVRGLN